MKEHPILFSTEMVQAILAGRKTQTRRVMKPQPKYDPPKVQELWRCPYGQPGDRLWVRETWRDVCTTIHTDNGDKDWEFIEYKATDDEVGKKWRPSIFMSRQDSRITLEVLNVRVQRVQEITEEDAIAEGVCKCGHPCQDYFDDIPCACTMNNFRKIFSWTWDSINAKREGCSWADNPWVWVIEFHGCGLFKNLPEHIEENH